MADLKVLIPREKIAQRVAEMGAEITQDYAGQSVILLGVLKGAAIFLSDLSRQLRIDATFDFIGVSSYGNRPSPAQELKSGWDSTGEVRLTKDMDQSMIGKNVVLVEDILDTGLTLTYLKKMLMARQPKSLKIAALLDKPSRRRQPITADYVGFSIPDEFVVGYGLDYAKPEIEKWRRERSCSCGTTMAPARTRTLAPPFFGGRCSRRFGSTWFTS